MVLYYPNKMKAQQSRNNHATMKKTKKITNLHDYSKEVDKIIATGKPMVEQFMDLMGLMDVTFIDENQTSNGRLHQLTKSDSSIKRPKKQDSSVQDKQTTEKSSAVENNRIKKKRKSSQNEVFGIGGKIDRFFLSGDDITLYKINRFIRKLFLDILKHNQDDMTGLYDYDGIAQEVIDLIQK